MLLYLILEVVIFVIEIFVCVKVVMLVFNLGKGWVSNNIICRGFLEYCWYFV